MKLGKTRCSKCGRELITTHELGRNMCEYCASKEDTISSSIIVGLAIVLGLIAFTFFL